MASPLPRQGPRPLPLHLTIAQTVWTSCWLASASWNGASTPWSDPTGTGPLPALTPALAAALTEASRLPPSDRARAADRELRRRWTLFLTGIDRYRHHPYRRTLPDPPVLWREGSARLLDYGPAGGRPVLFVPSLVNRSYVLDLSARRSLMRWLSGQGVRPLLLDWGTPGALERSLTLTDVIAGRLARAAQALAARTGKPAPVAGYCMGGLLVAGLAAIRPDLVPKALFLATPWDFHRGDPTNGLRVTALGRAFAPAIALTGGLPVDALQTLFATLDPLTAIRKFTALARWEATSDKAEAFVALEDWLNDGVALPEAIARECLESWYGRNLTARGAWRVSGLSVEPPHLAGPSLHIIPANDRIVPPGSARALADAMPGAEVLEPTLGHIGMVVGGAARPMVWEPLKNWLLRD